MSPDALPRDLRDTALESAAVADALERIWRTPPGWRGFFSTVDHKVIGRRGPALWALSTQAGQVLPYLDCRMHSPWSLLVPLLGAAFSLASAALAWRALVGGQAALRRGDMAFALVASLGVMLGLLLALAMFLQAIGPMVLSGCET